METQKIINLLNAIPLNDSSKGESKFAIKSDIL